MTESTEPTPQTEPTKFTRLRTSIIIVSMIAMPLFAVIGVKMPKFLSEKANESAGVTSAAEKPKPIAKPNGTRGERRPDVQSNAHTSGLEKPAGLDRAVSLAQAEAEHPLHNHSSPTVGFASPATFAGANTDVRAGDSGVSQAVGLESMQGSPDAFAAAPVGFDAGNRIQPLPPLDDSARSHSASGLTAAGTPAASSATANSTAAGGDQFSHIQSRLKALGATHYTLETWGTGGNSFRFQCRMAAGHSADYTRQFEATDTEPLRTMQTVLDEVEAWKAGRLP